MTVVTRRRLPLFGHVVAGEMEPNATGAMVTRIWETLPRQFQGMHAGDSIVMPNYFHGIVILGENVGAALAAASHEQSTSARAGTSPASTPPNLGGIVGTFKSLAARAYTIGVTDEGWPSLSGHLWQRNYYEHVIRSDEDWDRIRRCIAANAHNWDADHKNPAMVGHE